MTQSNSFDAFTLFKELYNQTESAWRDVIQETLEKPSFSENLGNVQTTYLQYQELVNKMTENFLKQANIPSKETIADLASLVINVESKVDNLEELLEDQTINDEIDQLSKKITRLEKKMDTIIELLNNNCSASSWLKRQKKFLNNYAC